MRDGQRAIFFDLDGTLADSVGVMRRVFAQFAAAYDRDGADVDVAAGNGPPVTMFLARLKREWALTASLDALTRHYHTLIDAAFLGVIPARGATETLEGAFRNGWTVGIVTANRGARCRAWLARTGLAPFVDIVVGAEDAVLGKPEPEPYLIALARSGAPRHGVIAVEGSPQGARSAVAAGLRTFGVMADGGEASFGAQPDWPESIRLIGSLAEMQPELNRERRRVVGARW
jgi:beta-phosphoglucomutase-like phosphatase (HAD superfamily)